MQITIGTVSAEARPCASPPARPGIAAVPGSSVRDAGNGEIDMDAGRIEAVVAECERQVAAGGSVDLRGTGFWKAVSGVKRDPAMVERFADRMAAIDRAAFERWARWKLPLGAGMWLMALLAAASLAAIAIGYYLSEPWNGLFLLGGAVALETAVHTPAHWLVGRGAGIAFTHWYVASVTRPQPGVKIDYASYLRAPARGRARMHAAGAVATKVVPFLLLGAAWGMGAPAWAWVALVVLGLAQILTDVLWSVKKSDWKRYRREMRIAVAPDRGSAGGTPTNV
ncbi:MAG: hypothetical protein PVI35_04585 [Acidimicrobiia bacterium]